MTQTTQTDSNDEEIGYVRVGVVGMVPPGFSNTILSGGLTGTVLDNGHINIDGSNVTMRLADPDAIDAGTEVSITRRRGSEWCIPIEEQKRRKYEQKAKRHMKAREKRKERNQKRADAEEFWDQYDIPFEHDVAIKGRLSGLSRGSWGDGRASNTVEHLYCKESFTDGRLSRDEDEYLCEPGASWEFERERWSDGDGNTYVPKVTCQQCLGYMDRWEKDHADK